MPDNIFESLLEQKIELFKASFIIHAKDLYFDEELKKLKHPGEYGTYREELCKEFLRFFIPFKFAIDDGFLINHSNEISKQCDIIVFDDNSPPLIETYANQRFFPIEAVVGLGEVKSTLNKKGLKEAINKLARNKALRSNIRQRFFKRSESQEMGDIPFDPTLNPEDNIFSFLICQKFDFQFKNLPNEIDQMYESDIAHNHRHNLILSLEDGLLAYRDRKGKTMNAYFFRSTKFDKGGYKTAVRYHKNRLVICSDEKDDHIKDFCHYLFEGIKSTTILQTDILKYLGKSKGGNYIDQG